MIDHIQQPFINKQDVQDKDYIVDISKRKKVQTFIIFINDYQKPQQTTIHVSIYNQCNLSLYANSSLKI